MRFALIPFVLLTVALGSCGPSMVDMSTGNREFNVDSSGTQECPGDLFQLASEHRATCGTPPQACLSANHNIMCSCGTSTSGTGGTWFCSDVSLQDH